MYASEIMEKSPISYVRDAQLRGSIFNSGESCGLVSAVDSGFFVDSSQPSTLLLPAVLPAWTPEALAGLMVGMMPWHPWTVALCQKSYIVGDNMGSKSQAAVR
jgi:hypothetical protein